MPDRLGSDDRMAIFFVLAPKLLQLCWLALTTLEAARGPAQIHAHGMYPCTEMSRAQV